MQACVTHLGHVLAAAHDGAHDLLLAAGAGVQRAGVRSGCVQLCTCSMCA